MKKTIQYKFEIIAKGVTKKFHKDLPPGVVASEVVIYKEVDPENVMLLVSLNEKAEEFLHSIFEVKILEVK